MKGVIVFALFAFVAVQLCQSAPMPEDDKKKEDTTPPPAAPAETTKVTVERAEAKETKSPEVVTTETTAKPEEKKS